MLFPRTSLRFIAFLLCLVFLTNRSALATPTLTPDQARQKIQKVHVDRWVLIREVNGVELGGRILSIDTDAFTLQTGNHPDTVTIPYDQLTYIRGQASTSTHLIIAGVMVGAFAITAVLRHNAYENSVANMPKLPTMPAFPAAR